MEYAVVAVGAVANTLVARASWIGMRLEVERQVDEWGGFVRGPVELVKAVRSTSRVTFLASIAIYVALGLELYLAVD